MTTAMRLAGVTLAAQLLGLPLLWAAEDHEHAAGAAEESHTDAPPVARRLWHDLVCLCGRCARLTLAACACPDAAAERQKVLELLRGRDLSTPASSEAAYQAVVSAYVGRFGGRHVLAAERGSQEGGWVAWAVLGSVIAAVGGAAFALAQFRRRRGRRAGGHAPRRRRNR